MLYMTKLVTGTEDCRPRLGSRELRVFFPKPAENPNTCRQHGNEISKKGSHLPNFVSPQATSRKGLGYTSFGYYGPTNMPLGLVVAEEPYPSHGIPSTSGMCSQTLIVSRLVWDSNAEFECSTRVHTPNTHSHTNSLTHGTASLGHR